MFVAIRRSASRGIKRCAVTMLLTDEDLRSLLDDEAISWLDRRSRQGEFYVVAAGDPDERGIYDWFYLNEEMVTVEIPRPLLSDMLVKKMPLFNAEGGMHAILLKARGGGRRWRFFVSRCHNEQEAVQALAKNGLYPMIDRYGAIVHAGDNSRMAINQQN